MKKGFDLSLLMRTSSLVLFFVFANTLAVLAQKNFAKQSESFSIISPHFGGYLPAGDYDEYFGYHFMLGGQYAYKTKTNWVFGLEGNFTFGNKVESDDMLRFVRTADNEILDEDGMLATVLFFQRGYSFLGTASKIIPGIIGPNPNSGITVGAGLGFMSHKVRVENQNNRIPFLDNDYEALYDRLSQGFVLKQSLGYTHFSNNKLTNFYFGFEIYQGFTKNYRDFNVDLGGPDKRSRLDISYGVRLAWLIPVYSRISNEYYVD